MEDFLSAISVSLICTFSSTGLSALLGVPLGLAIARTEFHGKGVLLAVLQSLLAVPTVVVGLLVYTVLRRGGLLGDLGLLYTMGAITIGQTILAIPIMTVFTHSAVRAVDERAVETAITLGAGAMGATRALAREARFGILAAVAAAFGRLVGEVGVSMMVGGNIMDSTRTMTTAIALETAKGEFELGLRLGLTLLVLALGVNLLLRLFQGRAQS